jgi:hypothetical protein
MEIPTNKNVLPDPSQAVSEDIKTPEVVPAVVEPEQPVVTPPVEPGTPVVEPVKPIEDKVVPLSALEEERTWRKDWEKKYKDLESTINSHEKPDPVEILVGDEALRNEVKILNQRIASFENKDTRKTLEVTYPQLVDKRTEFDEFLGKEENKGLPISRAATLFLAENGLLGTTPIKRDGLEQPVGGGHIPPVTGLDKDEIKRIRETQPRKYIQMIREGKINPDDIK